MADVLFGWDIGGAHVKAARLAGGVLVDAVQWPCPLWQGLDHLARVLAGAQQRWPDLADAAHAVTMTGEMVDCFAHREDGVQRIAALLSAVLPRPRFFAGDAGWCDASAIGAHWSQVASANWLATARHAALAFSEDEGLLVDIGSTTTDLIAFRRGRLLTAARSDAERLASGELVYQGVARTPLCALAQRVPWRGARLNVMNEFFATTADVYRTTGELDPAHDQHPAADGAAKDAPHTQARLARMIGLDARDGSVDEWQAFARAWRHAQCEELHAQVGRVVVLHGLGPRSVVVAAGCGAFLAPDVAPPAWRRRDYGREVAPLPPDAPAALRAWSTVGAPAVAVASLYAREQR